MTVIHAREALLPGGWADGVRVTLGEGRILSVEQGVPGGHGVLVPAMTNLHSHGFQRALAGLAEGRGPGKDSFWTWRDTMYRLVGELTPDDVEAITALAQVEMLEAGFAAVAEFHYLHHGAGGTVYADPAEMSVVIAAAAETTGAGLTLLPALYMQGGSDGRTLEGRQLRFGCGRDLYEKVVAGAEQAIAALSDARVGIAPHSLRAVGVEALTWATGMKPGSPFHLHIAEQLAEVNEILGTHGATPVKWLLEVMDVDESWCLIHATHASPAEVEGLARSGAVAGLCPLTEANLGDGLFDAARYQAAGGRWGIGTDQNVPVSLAGELRMLEYGQRLEHRARGVLAEPGASVGRSIFDTAISGGAQAAGRESGVIRSGAWADLALLDTGALALEGLSGNAVLDAWIFAGGDGLVAELWSAGRHVVTGGRHVRRDPVERRYRRVMQRLRDVL